MSPVLLLEPVWAWLMLLLVPTLLLARGAFRSMARIRRRLTIGVRTALISLLVLVLAGLVTVRVSDRLSVIALVDASDSVALLAAEGGGRDEDARSVVRAASENLGPEDALGIVAFGSSPLTIANPSGSDPDDRPIRIPEGWRGGTDLAAALRRAGDSVPHDAAGRVLLISDGVSTTGDPIAVARELASRELRVDVVPVRYDVPPEVVVESLDAPPRATVGSRVDLRVTFRATRPARGTLRLLLEGRPVVLDEAIGSTARDLALPAGRSVERISLRLPEAALHRFEAVFEPDQPAGSSSAGAPPMDTIARNNRARAATITPGRGRVLVLGASGGPLAETIRNAGFGVTEMDPGALLPDLLALQAYDLVVLQNVPADAIVRAAHDTLDTYVREMGGGLVMLGGDASFGAGGWRGSPIADLLPVGLDLPETLIVPEAAVVFVLDKSGSMGRSVLGSASSQQQIANEAAAEAVASLDPKDLVGVVAFNANATLVQPLAVNDDPAATGDVLRSISPGGGTRLGPAMEMALGQLAGSDAKIKHVIILSDGESKESGELPGIAARMRNEGVKVSTIGVGDQADLNTLRLIARQGDGVFYSVVDPSRLPRVLLKAVRVVRSPMIRESPFVPARLPTGSALLDPLIGLDIPPLEGLTLTVPLDDPRAVHALATPTGEPVLSSWNVELGRVVAFTSDADRWARRWLDGWPGYQSFWASLARQTARPIAAQDAYALTAVSEGGVLSVRLEASDDDASPIDGLVIPLNAYAPSGEAIPIELRQTGPGVYEGEARTAEPGIHTLIARPIADGSASRPLVATADVRTGQEFVSLESDPQTLQEIARVTGGRVFEFGSPIEDLFSREGIDPVRALLPVWPILLTAALVVFLLDVGNRRVAWDRFLSSEFATSAVERARHATRDRSERASGALGALASRPGRPAPDDAPRAKWLSEEDAERVAQDASQRRLRAQAERLRAIREQRRTSQAAPSDAQDPATRTTTPGSADKAPEPGPSSLLDAKRRARARFESPEDEIDDS